MGKEVVFDGMCAGVQGSDVRLIVDCHVDYPVSACGATIFATPRRGDATWTSRRSGKGISSMPISGTHSITITSGIHIDGRVQANALRRTQA